MRPDHEVEPHLPEHLTHLRKENQRPRSVRERRLAVLRFARYFGHPVAEVTPDELVGWQDDKLEKLKPAGMHNEIVHVSCYLRWLSDTGRRQDNPSSALVRPKHVHTRNPSPAEDHDIEMALAEAVQPIHLWIGLAAFCGLRCVEIASLAREDVIDGPRSSYLHVTGKGGKQRKVALPEHLRNEIESGPFNRAGHLFNRMDGKSGPPSAMRVSERINDYLHSLGIRATAHKLRHRYGTAMYEQTHNPLLVADMMGHASIDTTRGYISVITDAAAEAAEAITQLRKRRPA